MIRVATDYDCEKCRAANSSCTKEPTIIVEVGDDFPFGLCVSCAKELFNALGFIVMSQTGESIQRLVGLSKRRGDK